jgi:hypothetical protein
MLSRRIRNMSPKDKHLADNAKRTSVSLTPEDKAAIFLIGIARQAKGDKRHRINDILVDSLWYFFEKSMGGTREQIRTMLPKISNEERRPAKITEMPKPKRKN